MPRETDWLVRLMTRMGNRGLFTSFLTSYRVKEVLKRDGAAEVDAGFYASKDAIVVIEDCEYPLDRSGLGRDEPLRIGYEWRPDSIIVYYPGEPKVKIPFNNLHAWWPTDHSNKHEPQLVEDSLDRHHLVSNDIKVRGQRLSTEEALKILEIVPREEVEKFCAHTICFENWSGRRSGRWTDLDMVLFYSYNLCVIELKQTILNRGGIAVPDQQFSILESLERRWYGACVRYLWQLREPGDYGLHLGLSGSEDKYRWVSADIPRWGQRTLSRKPSPSWIKIDVPSNDGGAKAIRWVSVAETSPHGRLNNLTMRDLIDQPGMYDGAFEDIKLYDASDDSESYF